jgi:glycine/D-amino acid oxidase-like deaminating enzyme
MGCGGKGITVSAIAARMLQSMVQGLPDPDADLFALG